MFGEPTGLLYSVVGKNVAFWETYIAYLREGVDNWKKVIDLYRRYNEAFGEWNQDQGYPQTDPANLLLKVSDAVYEKILEAVENLEWAGILLGRARDMLDQIKKELAEDREKLELGLREHLAKFKNNDIYGKWETANKQKRKREAEEVLEESMVEDIIHGGVVPYRSFITRFLEEMKMNVKKIGELGQLP